MKTNKLQIHSAGPAVLSIHGQADDCTVTEKLNSFPDTCPRLPGRFQATAGAYQADE